MSAIKNFEAFVRDKVSKNKNMLVPWYLLCCCAYYKYNESLVSDIFFDLVITKKLIKYWKEIKHENKNLLKRHQLTSGYDLSYPTRVQQTTELLILKLKEKDYDFTRKTKPRTIIKKYKLPKRFKFKKIR